MTQDAAPISASRGNVPAGGSENINPENPDEADPRALPPDAAFSPGSSAPTGSEAGMTGRSALPREAVAQEPDDTDTAPNDDGPHGTPANTWSTIASDAEADVDGSLDASRQNPQGVDGVRASDS